MNRDKQIDELADAIFLNCHAGLFEDEAKMIAKFCYQEIDRKASDGAREIFEEIEKAIYHLETPLGKYLVINIGRFAELKKKYTEMEKENGI